MNAKNKYHDPMKKKYAWFVWWLSLQTVMISVGLKYKDGNEDIIHIHDFAVCSTVDMMKQYLKYIQVSF